MLSIGPYSLRNRVLLAPMAGVTDAPFRGLAWRFGAGYVVGEMVSAREELWHSAKSRLRRRGVAGINPRVVQIAGSDPCSVAASARRHWLAGAEVIDLNFGCPAKKVCRKAAGSALLRDPELVARIVGHTVAAVEAPVTVKMRTGWCRADRNGVDIARRIEDAGAAALAVHGRTRECRFLGVAEHDTVAEIKAAVSIPVFANGDIDSPERARRVLAHTGCDGVMIGRAALGQPWLLGDIAAGRTPRRGASERLAVIIEHVRSLHTFYGVRGVRIARKHVSWYVQRMKTQCAQTLLDCSNLGEGFNVLDEANAQLDYLCGYLARAAG